MKFATKPIRHYPRHFGNVATLSWEIKKSNLPKYSADMEKCEQIAFLSLLTLLIIHKF